jgi:hypothetical protein
VRSIATESLLLAALTCVDNSARFARRPDYAGFWLFGDHATNKGEIVASIPIVDFGDGAIIRFADGPYKHSTIPSSPLPVPQRPAVN